MVESMKKASLALTVIVGVASYAGDNRRHYAVEDTISTFNYEGIRLLPGRWQQQYEDVKAFFLSLDPNGASASCRRLCWTTKL